VKPILLVAFQLIVLGLVLRHAWRHPSTVYRALMSATYLGVIGFDIWYFADYAYRGTGFLWWS
jgi:hypothetical protein